MPWYDYAVRTAFCTNDLLLLIFRQADVLLSEASIIVVADYLGTATVIRWLLSKNISYPGTVYVTKETWMLAW